MNPLQAPATAPQPLAQTNPFTTSGRAPISLWLVTAFTLLLIAAAMLEQA